MILKYTLTPYLYGLPGTSTNIYSMTDLKNTFKITDINTGLLIDPLNIDYDSTQSAIYIKISYIQYYK